MRRKQLFDNEYYNSLLQNEIDKIADANGKNVVINITIPQQKEFMTVQDVADMLGVSTSHYACIEQGTHNPSTKIVKAFCKVFGNENASLIIGS